ncbi:MAG: hypothetical protein L3J67_10500 [Hyphomicrobiaceae bacterium]|nr:hypothetical protein [Hyphomicrobiaceae bacterium]
MNGITAFGMLGWGGAAMLAAVDLFKPTLAPNIRNDIKNRAFGWAGARTLMLAGLVGFSALAAYTTLMQFAAHRSDGPDRQAAAWHASKQRLNTARAAADAITARPPATIEPLIGSASVDKRIWTRTAGCTDVTLPASKASCLVIGNLRSELKQAREKQRLLAIVTRETATMVRLGSPLETHPGAAGIARLTSYSRDEVRYAMFAFAGLLIELVATFGLLLGARSKPKRKSKNEPPGSIYEALKLKVDENGNVTTSYRMLAEEMGWYIKGKKPNVSRVKRRLEKKQKDGLLTYQPSPTGTKVRLMEYA